MTGGVLEISKNYGGIRRGRYCQFLRGLFISRVSVSFTISLSTCISFLRFTFYFLLRCSSTIYYLGVQEIQVQLSLKFPTRNSFPAFGRFIIIQTSMMKTMWVDMKGSFKLDFVINWIQATIMGDLSSYPSITIRTEEKDNRTMNLHKHFRSWKSYVLVFTGTFVCVGLMLNILYTITQINIMSFNSAEALFGPCRRWNEISRVL